MRDLDLGKPPGDQQLRILLRHSEIHFPAARPFKVPFQRTRIEVLKDLGPGLKTQLPGPKIQLQDLPHSFPLPPNLASQGWGHTFWIQATRAKIGEKLSPEKQVTEDTEL